MEDLDDLNPTLAQWLKRSHAYGVLEHERIAATSVYGLLAGALAICAGVLERPTEDAVLVVFSEICRRADAPSETPVRTVH